MILAGSWKWDGFGANQMAHRVRVCCWRPRGFGFRSVGTSDTAATGLQARTTLARPGANVHAAEVFGGVFFLAQYAGLDLERASASGVSKPGAIDASVPARI